MKITTEQLLKLVESGFTKAEILALCTEQPKQEQPKQEQPKPEQPKPEQPKPEQPKPEQPKPEPQNAKISDEQMTALLQAIKTQNTSVDIPPTQTINDILAEHYKDIMLGK